jgi:DNA-binding CsgD family transcriptional regulator
VTAHGSRGPGLFLIGRDQELDELRDAFQRAEAGEGSVVLVVGEPGIGKTALCRSFGADVATGGGAVLLGHCYEEGALAVPFGAFVEAIEAAIARVDEQALKRDLGTGGVILARLVPELRVMLGIDLSERNEASQRELLKAVAEFFHGLARRQPLLLVLEDLHWADQDTLDLLLFLARNLEGSRLLIVGTYRDVEVSRSHPFASALAEVRRQGHTSRIRLRGLSRGDSLAMLSALTGGEVDRGQADAIYEQTDGNPFFIREIERFFEEQGIDLREAANDSPGLSRLGIPEGVRDVIGSRLTRLGPECNQVLAVASAIGREFDLQTLAGCVDLHEEAVVEALEAAIAAGIIEQPVSGERHRFSHALIRETLYRELSAARRGRLHERIALHIEAQSLPAPERRAGELAEHFANSARADGFARAVHYGRLAAEQAMSVFAYGEATRLLDRAIDLQEAYARPDETARCELLLQLGEVLVAAGDRLRIVDDVAPRALALARSLQHRTYAFAACRLALAVVVTSSEAGLFWLEAAEAYVDDDPGRRIALHRFRAIRAFHAGDFRLARDLLLEVLDLARKHRDPAEFGLVSILVRLAVLDDAEGRAYIEDYASRSQAGVPTPQRAQLYLDLTGIPLQWGERMKARVMRDELATLARTTREYMADLMSTIVDATFAMLDGDLRGALDGFTTAVAADRDPFSHILRARVACWLGELSVVEEEYDFFGRTPQLVNKYYRALLLAFRGQEENAREDLAVLVPALVEQAQREPISKWFSATLLEAASLIGDEAAARDLAALVHDDEPPLRHPILVFQARHLAKSLQLGGRFEAARAKFLEAVGFCENLGYRPERALTQCDLAHLLLQHFPDQRSEAISYLDLAAAEFESLGMTLHLERSLALKTAVSSGQASRRPAFPDGLSEREVEVLRLVSTGKTNQQIADDLVISLNTVFRHVSSIFNKTGAANRTEAANYARTHGLA